ncbi:hypothetical protein L1887_59691 [Cichorium endivia]|nr:hypothetical protein L1887_59691 [Cichorium endivia]
MVHEGMRRGRLGLLPVESVERAVSARCALISERSVCVSTTSLELFGLMAGGTVMALNMQDEAEAQVYTASQEETGHLAGKTGDEEQNVVLATGEIRSAKCAG